MKFTAVTLLALGCAWCAQSATAEDYATQALQATYKIIHNDSTATCFLVRDTKAGEDQKGNFEAILVTANHVLAQMRSATAVLLLRQRRDDGTYARREVTIPVRADENPLWTKHPQHDVAILDVTLPNDVTARPLPVACLADEESLKTAGIHIGQSLLALSYPVRFEANSSGFPIARQLVLASYPLIPVAPHPVFLVDMHTFPGDSGGPVFVSDPRLQGDPKNQSPLVLGLVVGMVRHDEKTKLMLEERTVHHALNLGTVLQSQFVLETIALRKRSKATGGPEE